MATIQPQARKAEQFRELHHSGKLLMLPNVWDSLGANLLQDLHYPAVATASASIAYTQHYKDGEHIPLNQLLPILKKIADSVEIPVSADIESGYAATEQELRESIRQFTATGIVGINIEDTNKETNALYSIEEQCRRIQIIKEVGEEMGVPLFVNARADVFLRGDEWGSADAKFEETLKRGQAYKEVGADCFYPMIVRKEEYIKGFVEELQMPINILALSGIPDLKKLNEIGVARVSLGPSFLKIAMQAMKKLALKLSEFDGLTDIIENEVTSDYLVSLISKK